MWEQETQQPEIQAFKKVPNATVMEKLQVQRQSCERRVPTDDQRHRRRELPVFEDSFTKRLGIQADFDHMKLERSFPPSTSSQWLRKKEVEHIAKQGDAISGNLLRWRDLEVVKVPNSGCKCRPDNDGSLPLGVEKQRHSHASTKQSSAARALNGKQSRGLGALTWKLFRQKSTTVFNPAWEVEWANFREQHEQEMKEMKQMYAGLQEMCQEIKRLGLQQDDILMSSSRCASSSKSCDSHGRRLDGAPLIAQNKWRPGSTTTTHASGLPHQTRRTKSAPKTRVNWNIGLTKENSMHVKGPYKAVWYCPTTALFEEIVQVERVYLRNFCGTLMKFGETRTAAADLVMDHQRREAMSSLVARLVPHARFAKPWHFKYGMEAWLNKVVFQDFGRASLNLQDDASDRLQEAQARRISSWEEYQKLSLLSPIDAIDPEGKVYYRNFHVFCHRKFQVIHDQLQWWDEWPDNLVEDFLEAMKHVWRAYKLALVFEPPASIFSAKPSTVFDGKFMEHLEVLTALPNDELLAPSNQAGFSVTPGFVVQKRIIKSQVYLNAKSGPSKSQM
ncbi:unnamed protein product [Sphagnum troendelagicum]|uniref:GIL1/IRKI C-terminal domain-containing protein n=1 Tax=Sphagnum troendelagicum TaxID=128251 RepID=A0ABP0UZL8_9BRYO